MGAGSRPTMERFRPVRYSDHKGTGKGCGKCGIDAVLSPVYRFINTDGRYRIDHCNTCGTDHLVLMGIAGK